MTRILRYALVATILFAALILPLPAESETPPPVIEVTLSLTDLPAPVVNVTVPEQPAPVVNLPAFPEFPEQAAPVVNVTVPQQPAPVVNMEQAATPEPRIIYEDREVEVEKIVEVPACIDFAELPYFDLANALTVAFPGEPWSLSGSHYPGLVWQGEGDKPDMTAIIAGWLTHLESEC